MTVKIGKTALVTGGGTGIGRAVAERLVQAGTEVIYINYSRSGDAAEETAARLREMGATAHAVRADISDHSAVTELIARIGTDHGSLNHLVNNAGVTELIPFTDLDAVTRETWDHLWRVNVLGTFEVTRAAGPLLRKAQGSVVNIASIAARRAVGSSIPYGVTKAAIVQLTKSLAVALAPDVRVNAVSAGTVQTRWHDRLVGAESFKHRAAAEAEQVPLRRLADAEDIAEAVVGLLGMAFVTGEDLLVDGGKGLKY